MVSQRFERKLNGEVEYQGEDGPDRGVIVVKDNVVTVLEGTRASNEAKDRLVQDLNIETHLLAGASGTVCNRVTVTIGTGTGAQTGDYSSALRGQNACPQIMRF